MIELQVSHHYSSYSPEKVYLAPGQFRPNPVINDKETPDIDAPFRGQACTGVKPEVGWTGDKRKIIEALIGAQVRNLKAGVLAIGRTQLDCFLHI